MAGHTGVDCKKSRRLGPAHVSLFARYTASLFGYAGRGAAVAIAPNYFKPELLSEAQHRPLEIVILPTAEALLVCGYWAMFYQ